MNTPPKGSVLVNVCIIPPAKVGEQCVVLAQSLKEGTVSVLDGKTKFAHMTVAMLRVDEGDVPDIVKAVGSALELQRSFQCKYVGDYKTPGRYFEISYQKTLEFMALHEMLLDLLKRYQLNPGDPYQESYFGIYDTEQQRNARETGYDLAHDRYRPHITLLRWEEGRAPKTSLELPRVDLSFDLGTVCIYLAEENGAVYQELAHFAIK